MTATTQDAEIRNAATWFEIPVLDMARARKFYESVLGTPMREESFGGAPMALFSYERPGIGGCLAIGDNVAPPAADGTLVYLNAAPSLSAALGRVAAAGGRVVLPTTQLPDGMGAFAHIIDTEGNRVGLHAV